MAPGKRPFEIQTTSSLRWYKAKGRKKGHRNNCLYMAQFCARISFQNIVYLYLLLWISNGLAGLAIFQIQLTFLLQLFTTDVRDPSRTEFGGLRRSLESKLSRIVLQVTCPSPTFDPRHLGLKTKKSGGNNSCFWNSRTLSKKILRFMDKEVANGDQYYHENVSLLLHWIMVNILADTRIEFRMIKKIFGFIVWN